MSRRRVVVTGFGLISPVGNSVDSAWANVCNGVSGIGPIETWDVSTFSTRFAGTIRDFDVSAYMEPKEARKCDPFMQYGIAAAQQAIADCGLEASDETAHRIGVMMGSGIGGVYTIETNHSKWLESGARRISPFFVPASIINMISGHVSIMNGFKGPNLSTVTACTTSTHWCTRCATSRGCTARRFAPRSSDRSGSRCA